MRIAFSVTPRLDESHDRIGVGNGIKRLVKILPQIIDVFTADGNSDEFIQYAG